MGNPGQETGESWLSDQQLSEIANLARNKAGAETSLDDLGKIVTIVKSVSDVMKLRVEAKNARRQILKDALQSFSSILVPLISIFGLLATLWIATHQLQASQRQSEDTQWRDLLVSLKDVDKLKPDVTAAPRLLSFFESPNYREAAIEVSKHLMGNIADVAGFSELYQEIFSNLTIDNIDDSLDILRLLNDTYKRVSYECYTVTQIYNSEADNSEFGLCSSSVSLKEVKKILKKNPEQLEKVIQLYETSDYIVDEISLVSKSIAAFLKKEYSVSNSNLEKPALDLSNVYIRNADLSKVDFSRFDISDAVFDFVNIEGSNITPYKFTAADFRYAAWWDASVIDQVALARLIRREFPYYERNEVYYGGVTVTRDEYTKKIERLCTSRLVECLPANLRFAED